MNTGAKNNFAFIDNNELPPICFSTDSVKEIREYIKTTPLTLNDNIIKERDSEKYLGEYLHKEGINESIKLTVNERYWRAISAILEIKTVIQDYRSEHIGGLLAGVNIWELAVIPMLLNNSSTWNDVQSETMNKLKDIQNTLLRLSLIHI